MGEDHNKLEKIQVEFSQDLGSASNRKHWETLKIKYLGKKGSIPELLKMIPTLAEEKKKDFGQGINQLKNKITTSLNQFLESLEEDEIKNMSKGKRVDYNLPGYRHRKIGKRHPLQIVQDEVVGILNTMGFKTVASSEVETEFYNFEALNISEGHPARDSQDSFYIDKERLLRTHTTTVDIHMLEKYEPPIGIVSPGRTYRRDAIDATHYPVFHQIDAMYVDKGLHFGHLKSLVHEICRQLFGEKTGIRFRPDYFPFTEPSCEISIQLKKGNNYLEVLGCGMLHSLILERFNINPKEYSGIAFGIGVERIAMIKYGVDDIRHFFNNEYSFLKQF